MRLNFTIKTFKNKRHNFEKSLFLGGKRGNSIILHDDSDGFVRDDSSHRGDLWTFEMPAVLVARPERAG